MNVIKQKVLVPVMTLFLTPLMAFAEATPSQPSTTQGIAPFVPIILMVGIFYFLIMRPQQKKAKQQQRFLSELKRGDMVITQSGIVGMIKTLSEKLVTLEVDEGVCLKVLRSQILEAANSLNKEPKPA